MDEIAIPSISIFIFIGGFCIIIKSIFFDLKYDIRSIESLALLSIIFLVLFFLSWPIKNKNLAFFKNKIVFSDQYDRWFWYRPPKEIYYKIIDKLLISQKYIIIFTKSGKKEEINILGLSEEDLIKLQKIFTKLRKSFPIEEKKS